LFSCAAWRAFTEFLRSIGSKVVPSGERRSPLGATVFPFLSLKETTMSAVNCVARFDGAGALLGSRTNRPENAPRKTECTLVSGGKTTKPRCWNWFDKFRFYVFG